MDHIDWHTPVPAGYRRDGRGNLVHETNISETDRDMDATTRKIHNFGKALSGQIWRFRAHSLDDVYGFQARVVEQYGGRVGGRKGNVRLRTFDDCLKVELAQAEYVDVGPEIAAAQALFMECIEEWAQRSPVNLKTLVAQAFSVDATGRMSVSQLLRLRRTHIDDDRWRAAQRALMDGIRPSGRVEYLRLYERSTPLEDWRPVPLHIATATAPPASEETPEQVLERRVRSAVEEARHHGLAQGAMLDILKRAHRRRANPGSASETPAAEETGETS